MIANGGKHPTERQLYEAGWEFPCSNPQCDRCYADGDSDDRAIIGDSFYCSQECADADKAQNERR